MKGSPVRVRASALPRALNGGPRIDIVRGGREREGECVISILVLTLRFAVATVLAVAATAKARDFDGFHRTVRALVPRGAAFVSVSVIAIEATLAALLVSGLAPSAVAAAAAALFLGFSALSLSAARSGGQISCNRFGSRDR